MRLRDFSQDEMAYYEVYLQNEYRLPARFAPEDVIVDVGAHIGCFALACLRRGAMAVRCYEADPANFALLEENMRPYSPIVAVHSEAVWRSDRDEPVSLYRRQAASLTAMSFVRPYDPRTTPSAAMPHVGLDAMLAAYRNVRLLKLDCEGSEYPILYTAKGLEAVQEIVMETHEKMPFDEWAGRCNSAALAEHLRGQGFEVAVEPHPICPDVNHHLFAKRLP